ncbi:PadR family transcriptional regulator (plasmid) [Streptomyces sp. NBC_01186]|nr:PadR family transcriptional regulator [Streptomyces sp. NBC_01775]WSS17963.1 PadR family transcriptional regulator [Streptomyces sp. NBC_01186]
MEAYWETPEPAGRPRRRYYRLTEQGDQSLRRVRQPQSRPWWRFRTGPAAS